MTQARNQNPLVPITGFLYKFSENPRAKHVWQGVNCAFCKKPKRPAIGLIVGFLDCPQRPDMPNLMENPWGTPEQQECITELYEYHPEANFYLPVCETHSEGEPQ